MASKTDGFDPSDWARQRQERIKKAQQLRETRRTGEAAAAEYTFRPHLVGKPPTSTSNQAPSSDVGGVSIQPKRGTYDLDSNSAAMAGAYGPSGSGGFGHEAPSAVGGDSLDQFASSARVMPRHANSEPDVGAGLRSVRSAINVVSPTGDSNDALGKEVRSRPEVRRYSLGSEETDRSRARDTNQPIGRGATQNQPIAEDAAGGYRSRPPVQGRSEKPPAGSRQRPSWNSDTKTKVPGPEDEVTVPAAALRDGRAYERGNGKVKSGLSMTSAQVPKVPPPPPRRSLPYTGEEPTSPSGSTNDEWRHKHTRDLPWNNNTNTNNTYTSANTYTQITNSTGDYAYEDDQIEQVGAGAAGGHAEARQNLSLLKMKIKHNRTVLRSQSANYSKQGTSVRTGNNSPPLQTPPGTHTQRQRPHSTHLNHTIGTTPISTGAYNSSVGLNMTVGQSSSPYASTKSPKYSVPAYGTQRAGGTDETDGRRISSRESHSRGSRGYTPPERESTSRNQSREGTSSYRNVQSRSSQQLSPRGELVGGRISPPRGGIVVGGEEAYLEGAGAELLPCADCGRKFLESALERHVKICKNVFIKKRKAFDAAKMRVAGTELAKYAANAGKKNAVGGAAMTNSNSRNQLKKGISADEMPVGGKDGAKQSKWRAQSIAFREAMRNARMVSNATTSGAPLPPTAPSAPDPSLVPCPKCGRRFNEDVAARHIPKCTAQVSQPLFMKRGAGRGLGVTARAIEEGKSSGIKTTKPRPKR